MYRKLQQNFDVIQYLVKNASPEQLAWRQERSGWSLGEIICHLRDVEAWHAHIRLQGSTGQERCSLPPVVPTPRPLETNRSPTEYIGAFETYARCRRKMVALLENARDWCHEIVTHPLFGRVTLTELVEKIDDYDQTYIQRMEDIIHDMPLNPLLARALYEISDYHRRYQPHLAQARSVLDIGVGPGLALRHVMRHNPHLTFAGVDVQDIRLPEVNVPLQLYDGHTLPFTENQFDISLLFYVLHHCRDPHRLLDEAVRVTCHKLIVIEEFNRPGVDETSLDLTERQSHRALGIPPDLPYQLFGKAEFETMLQKRNLIRLEKQPLPSQTTRPVQKYLYVMATGKWPENRIEDH